MALSAKLELRQGQTLVMTPQLQQAIKLLQLSNLELGAFVEAELERNPLLEREEAEARSDSLGDAPSPAGGDGADDGDFAGSDPDGADAVGIDSADQWLSRSEAAVDPAGSLDTDYHNVDPEAGVAEGVMPSDAGWSSVRTRGGSFEDADTSLEEYVAGEETLHEHLTAQLNLAIADPAQRLIGLNLIDLVDDAGYLRGDLEQVGERLGAGPELVLATLEQLQRFEPAGVFARDLAECLALQLQDRNRYDPVIAKLIDNLDLLAQHNLGALRRLCGVDQDELQDMIAEIRALNPKPGLGYGSAQVQTLIPDVIVRARNDGGWIVELNSETLPKVLINQSYYSTVSRNSKAGGAKSYLHDCLQSANWLVKTLDQRARTILKVAEEIVRQQDGFFAKGIQHLRPLNLKTVADAISMHESTVSRVTSNKYMTTPRGIYELKYFFTSAIASSESGEAHSSEAVRHRIKVMIEAETAEDVLSDDKLVELLRAEGIDIARRTVAKYRESMGIGSSVQRRREKRMTQRIKELA